MPVMLSKTYDALKAAGDPEDKHAPAIEQGVRVAAEESAGYENRLALIDIRLASIKGKFTVMLWAMGVNAAATIAILGVLLRGHGGLMQLRIDMLVP